MHSVLRLISFLLLVGALSLGGGPALTIEDLAYDPTAMASSGADTAHSHNHDSGTGEHKLAQHCGTAFCMSIFGIQPSRGEFQVAWEHSKFAVPPHDRYIRSKPSDCDPPVPRFIS